MNSTLRHPAARRALGLSLVAGAWLALSAFAPGVETPLPTGAVPDRIHVAQADEETTQSPVSYAAEQADRGETAFTKYCVECHGKDLKGGLLGGPPLRGVSFEEKYANGAPAGLLFEFMSATMPPDSPGRYSVSTYTDLMAYILKRNNFAVGAPLPSDVDALYSLIMEK